MPSVIKSFTYLANLESFAQVSPVNPDTFLLWESADGDPANGCLKMTADHPNGDGSHKVRSPSSTWEGWGVPAGSEVTLVQVALKGKTADAATSQAVALRILDSVNASVTSAGDLLPSTTLPSPSAWTSLTGPSRAVDFLSQESTETVKLEIEVVASAGSGSSDFRFDTIELTITYDDGTGGSEVPDIPISNLNGLVFMKGFAFASRIGGTPDAIGMAALQECSINHSYGYGYARGPESLQNLGVGVTDENLSGSIRHMVVSAEQFQVFLGGTISYNGGTGKTTYVKKVNEEPSAFNLHLKTPSDGSDLEIYVYKCLCTNQPVIEGGANREFKTFGVDWKAEGQSEAEGGKLFEMIFPGNQTGAS